MAAPIVGPKRKSSGGIAGAIIFLIIIVAIVVWVVHEARQDVNMSNEGCEVQAFNQWGQPTMWKCPPGADIDRTGMIGSD